MNQIVVEIVSLTFFPSKDHAPASFAICPSPVCDRHILFKVTNLWGRPEDLLCRSLWQRWERWTQRGEGRTRYVALYSGFSTPFAPVEDSSVSPGMEFRDLGRLGFHYGRFSSLQNDLFIVSLIPNQNPVLNSFLESHFHTGICEERLFLRYPDLGVRKICLLWVTNS